MTMELSHCIMVSCIMGASAMGVQELVALPPLVALSGIATINHEDAILSCLCFTVNRARLMRSATTQPKI
jgi:hypothetical protein